MVSDIISEALSAIGEFMSTSPDFYDDTDTMIIRKLCEEMRVVQRYFDTPPVMAGTEGETRQ